MIRAILCLKCVLLMTETAWSDTIGNYQHISKSIPKMEIKADEQAQAWANSARHVLTITNESIAETLVVLNKLAAKQGKPFFCFPKGRTLDSAYLGKLIEEFSQNIDQDLNNKLTVSEIALKAVEKKYPCRASSKDAFSSLRKTHAAMQHAQSEF